MQTRILFAITSVALMTVSAQSADDPVLLRRQVMSKSYRAESSALNLILGKYFPDKAAKAMKTIQDTLTIFPTLFPEGSAGGSSKASPEIWNNMDDFKALAAKVVADAATAETAAGAGQEAFAQAFAVVQADCDACHAKYDLGE